MEMKDKAEWHMGANNGFIPLMEIPDGTFLYESKALMEYANNLGGKQGLQLYFDDPVKAAK